MCSAERGQLDAAVCLHVPVPGPLRHEGVGHDLVCEVDDARVAQRKSRHAEGLPEEPLLGEAEAGGRAELIDDSLAQHAEDKDEQLGEGGGGWREGEGARERVREGEPGCTREGGGREREMGRQREGERRREGGGKRERERERESGRDRGRVSSKNALLKRSVC